MKQKFIVSVWLLAAAIFAFVPVGESTSQVKGKPKGGVVVAIKKDPIIAYAANKNAEADSLNEARRIEREKQEAYERYVKEQVKKGIEEFKRLKARNAILEKEAKEASLLRAENDQLRADLLQFRMIVQELNDKPPVHDTLTVKKGLINIKF